MFFHSFSHKTSNSPFFPPFSHRTQPRINKIMPTYTNCIVTLVWADGVPRTPPIIFTHDPKMKIWARKTPRRQAAENDLYRALDEFKITLDQLVYLDGKKKYVAESSAILEKYLSCGHSRKLCHFF